MEGLDDADFTVDGGVLRFKESPNYEASTDRMRAAVDDDDTTDVDEEEAAEEQRVPRNGAVHRREASRRGRARLRRARWTSSCTVTNLDERGKAVISLRQPETGHRTGTGSASDPDEITGTLTLRVVRPQGQQAHAYERHATGKTPQALQATLEDYTPGTDDEGKYLRLKATYRDGEGDDKAAYVRSEFRVREDVDD